MIKTFDQFCSKRINESASRPTAGKNTLFACGERDSAILYINPTSQQKSKIKRDYNSYSASIKTDCKVVIVGTDDDETEIIPVAKSANTWKQEAIKQCQVVIDYYKANEPELIEGDEIELGNYTDAEPGTPDLPMTNYISFDRNTSGQLTAKELFDAICKQIEDSEYDGDSGKGYVVVDIESGERLLGNSIMVYVE